jgi:hypothetical protein
VDEEKIVEISEFTSSESLEHVATQQIPPPLA